MVQALQTPRHKKRIFTKEEDEKILKYVNIYGQNWKEIASMIDGRTEKQCRERYRTYLNPSIRKDPFTPDEDALLIALYNSYGPKWAEISKHFIGRSDNMLKNRFNYHIIHRPRKVYYKPIVMQTTQMPSPQPLPEIPTPIESDSVFDFDDFDPYLELQLSGFQI